MIVVAFLFDILFTISISVGAAWFFTSRYLRSRTSTQLGQNDVKLLRSFRDQAMLLLMMDEQGTWLMPDAVKANLRRLVSQHDNQKELPG